MQTWRSLKQTKAKRHPQIHQNTNTTRSTKVNFESTMNTFKHIHKIQNMKVEQ